MKTPGPDALRFAMSAKKTDNLTLLPYRERKQRGPAP